jgi:hypothetical protein
MTAAETRITNMRKLLVAVCVVSGFTLATDAAWARIRVSIPFKPVAAKAPAAAAAAKSSTTTAKASDRSAPPRTWIVAVPRATSRASAAPASAEAGELSTFGDFAAGHVTDETAPQPAKIATPAPQPSGRLVVLNPTPPQQPKQVATRSHQPDNVAVCYWNRTGQCVR